MADVYLKAASFLLFILMGHLMRKYKVFGPEAQQVLAKLNLTVTLPCVVIVNFSGSSVDLSLIVILFLGVLEGMVLCVAGDVISRGMPERVRGTYMISSAGYNIGSFSMPYVQSFLPPLGTVAACVFDVGNALVSTGGAYSYAAAATHKGGETFSVLGTAKKLFSNPCIDTYLLMFALSVAGIVIPEWLTTLIRPAANANVFLAMFMLGLMFHIEFKREYLTRIFQILGLRLAFGAVFAAAAWFLLPFDLPVRQAMVLMPFSPITSVAPAFTQMLGADEGLASCVNSISIVLGLVILTALIACMGL